MLFANSTAILTDAFPSNQRGMALGINQVAAIAGSFLGLIIGGVLAAVALAGDLLGERAGRHRRHDLVLPLAARGRRPPRGRLDVLGNLTFAAGLGAVLAAITYGIQPYGGHTHGLDQPVGPARAHRRRACCWSCSASSRASVAEPMFQLGLFRIRAFSAGNLAGLLASIGRGGLQFMLIIWLQGIWLPLHGYAYASTPLWAGIYLLPLTIGFLVAGPRQRLPCPTASAPAPSPPAG